MPLVSMKTNEFINMKNKQKNINQNFLDQPWAKIKFIAFISNFPVALSVILNANIYFHAIELNFMTHVWK